MTTPAQGDPSPADKRAQLARLLAQKAGEAGKPQPPAPAQERLWFLEQLTPGTALYNLPVAVWLTGSLDQGALERALTEIVRRHAPLRTTFAAGEGGLPVQLIGQPGPQPLPVDDLSHLPEAEARAEAIRRARADGNQPFDLATGPLCRTRLYRVAPEVHFLTLVLHHIISDLWTVGIITQELSALYGAYAAGEPSPLPALTQSYLAYARQQRDLANSPEMESHLAYWKQKLGGRLPVLQLPFDRPRPPVQTSVGALHIALATPALTEGLKALARQEGATLYMVLLAAFKALLYRYTRQTDLIVGTPVANRNEAEHEALAGLFVNTLVVRTDLSGLESYRDLLARVRESCLGAYTHQEMDFSRLVDALQPDRALGAPALFQVMFSLGQTADQLSLPGIQTEWVEIHSGTAKFDLTLAASELDRGGMSLQFEYNTDLFDTATIERMAGHFQTLLEAIAANPGARVEDLPLLSGEEQAQLAAWNQTRAAYPREATVHRLIEARAAATPNAIAVLFGGVSLTYAELNGRANQLARHLRALGVGPDVLVGLSLERSEAMLVGLLGIWKAGGAYVPLDPTYPKDRLAYMLEDSGAPVLVTRGSVPVEFGGHVVDLERDWETIAAHGETDLGQTSGPANLAYVIYTSGSTGKPKGVALEHRTVVNFLTSMRQQPGLAPHDALLAVTSISFDIHVLELYLPLTTGARVVLASRADALNGERLSQLMAEHGVTVMQATPATWRLLLESGWKAPAGLTMLIGGEALTRELANRLTAGGATLWNMYGPTETTVWSTLWQVTPGAGPVLIGRPIANTQLHVLDGKLQPAPVGVAGELYIGGDGLARGYLHRPELTAERFIDSPYGRIYRTGDLARWRPDGQLEFLGRADFQVKVRGFRIELGEVETVLERHPAIAQAVAAALEIGGETELVGYYVPRGQALSVSELRSYLKEHLPEYMVPTRFMELKAFPLTPNGKVDRKALPEPAAAAPAAQADAAGVGAAPDTELEKAIAAIWRAVLRVDRVGLTDNFFDLGGHSLKLLQVFSRLKQAVDCPLELMELFQFTTVAALARHIREKQGHVVAAPAEAVQALQPAAVAAAAAAATGADGRTDIAVVGLAGRFPGANDVDAFWRNLRGGVEGLRRFDREELRQNSDLADLVDRPEYVPVKGVLEGAEFFDAGFFGMTPREAQALDPQQRVFLETAWSALEHAGYDPEAYPHRIGLWAGAGFNTYLLTNLAANPAFINSVGWYQIFIGNDKDFLATRTAYKLNLRGPAMAVQTACSTSLVAVHEACQALRLGECEMALAGGVAVTTPVEEGYLYQEGHILSRDGACRAFDAKSGGTVLGNGAGVVVLKRLEDALRDGDSIYAVIRGTAINNDGSGKIGFTAPSVEGQARVIRDALQQAGVTADSITYVEAHGTGTVLGDPIEVAGLTRAYREEGARENGYCAIGSVKTNIGHLDTAAGVAGLIKTVQALRHKELPPSLHFEEPNPKLGLESTPFVVNAALRPWETGGKPRRAGVSSLGIGGTNAHAVLEEAPVPVPTSPSRPNQLLLLSARSPAALDAATANLAAHLEENPGLNLADAAYTLQVGRRPLAHRRMLVCRDAADAVQALRAMAPARVISGQEGGLRQVCFLFPGQGAQFPGMLRGVYDSEEVFREALDRCAAELQKHLGFDIRPVIFDGPAERLSQTEVTQPALFAVEYAMARQWLAWGVRPRAMIGHSLGEYVAAVLSGVMRLEDALKLVTARGRLIGSLPGGAMLAVPLPETEVLPLLDEHLSLAAVNSPSATVVAGPTEAVEALQAQLAARGVEGRRLHTSHAFHCAMMEPILAEFEALAAQVKLSAPQIPFLSNVTGTWITEAEATSPQYWTRHIRQAVRFADGLTELFADPDAVLLEVGPGQSLAALARQHPGKGAGRVIVSSGRHVREQADDLAALLGALGRLWLAGVAVEWSGFYAGERRQRVALPTYPFERQRHWVEPVQHGVVAEIHTPEPPAMALAEVAAAEQAVGATAVDRGFEAPENDLEEAIAGVWQDVLGVARVGRHDNFFELGGDSLVASRMITRLREIFPVAVPLGAIFEAPAVAGLAARVEQLLIEKLESMSDEEAEGLS